MRKGDKDVGCLGSLISMFLLFYAGAIIVSVVGGLVGICAAFFTLIFFISIVCKIITAIHSHIKGRYSGKIESVRKDSPRKIESIPGGLRLSSSQRPEARSEEPKVCKERPKVYAQRPQSRSRYMSDYQVERYAIECNAYLEHQDEMRQYEQKSPKQAEKATVKENSSEKGINILYNQVDYMSGEDFEVFVANILTRIGFTKIRLTKGSGDQGVDIIAERDEIRYAIQCKRYSKPVGNKAVQEVFAGKSFYRCHVGVVITNNYFTQAAKELAKENGVVLWDRDFFNIYANVKNDNIAKTDEESIIEKICTINGDSVIFKYKKRNKIEILGICNTVLSSAHLYFALATKLKDEWVGKCNFAVVVSFGNGTSIAYNEDGNEFFGGKELNGEMVVGIPGWMDKARDDILGGDQYELLIKAQEVYNILDEFMELVSAYMDK